MIPPINNIVTNINELSETIYPDSINIKMEISRRLMIKLSFFMFLFLASGAFIGSFFIPRKTANDLELDFEGFVRMKERLKVELNGVEYRAEILEDLTFEKAREKCKNQSGSLAWNRVEGLPDTITSYWIECGSETDLDYLNVQSHCSEVSLF